MSTQKDPLSKPQTPDRVYYANGALLDQEDFTAEQVYHRGRMGRALAYLHGHGTVAGLAAGVQQQAQEDMLMVSAGLALDRLGRQIEVPRAACIRIGRWFQFQLDDPQGQDRLSNSFRSGSSGTPDGVVVDVFIKFDVCERGKQPAFATGNFDALDAVAPSRLRDSYRLELIIRQEQTVPIPESDFPDMAGLAPEQIQATIIQYKLQEAWKESTAWQGPVRPRRKPGRLLNPPVCVGIPQSANQPENVMCIVAEEVRDLSLHFRPCGHLLPALALEEAKNTPYVALTQHALQGVDNRLGPFEDHLSLDARWSRLLHLRRVWLQNHNGRRLRIQGSSRPALCYVS